MLLLGKPAACCMNLYLYCRVTLQDAAVGAPVADGRWWSNAFQEVAPGLEESKRFLQLRSFKFTIPPNTSSHKKQNCKEQKKHLLQRLELYLCPLGEHTGT